MIAYESVYMTLAKLVGGYLALFFVCLVIAVLIDMHNDRKSNQPKEGE